MEAYPTFINQHYVVHILTAVNYRKLSRRRKKERRKLYMNKLFTKIAALSVGLAMAVGVGVAVSSGSKQPARVSATSATISGGGSKNYAVNVVYNDETYSGIRYGTGSGTGNASFSVPASTTSFSFYAAAWSGKSATISVSISPNTTLTGDTSKSLTANSNISGNSTTGATYTFSGTDANHKFSFTCSALASASTVTITNGSGDKRAVIWNANYETGSSKTATTTSVSAVSTSLTIGATTTLSATVSHTGGTVTGATITYASSDTSVATVSGNTVTAVAAGTTTITGSYAGDSTYAASSGTVSITVTKATTTGAGTVYFGSGTKTGTIKVDAESVSGTDTLGNGWTVTTVMDATSFTQNAEYSQIGASTKPATSITFTQNFSSTLYVTSFEAKFGGFSSTAGTITATVGSTTIASGSLSGSSDVTINETTQSASGSSLVVTITDIAKGVKAYYISYTLSASATVTYTVTYNGNGSTGGSVPTDASSPYSSGAEVTVLGNTGSLVKTDYVFNGWNTEANGSGTARAAGSKFNISSNVTLYAQWIQTLDAITSITGTVTGSISQAGSYSWNFNNISVTGTLSGVADKDVKSYVDLSSTTAIPSSTGARTVSVTATKKSTVSGSATSLTNANISGVVEAAKLSYTVVFDYTAMLTANVSYANENANKPKVSTATCAGHDDIDIEWESYQVQRPNGSALWMQFQGSGNGCIFNTTEFPGDITDVTLTEANNNTAVFTTYYGNTERPTSGTTVGGKYFCSGITSGTGYLSSITVTFEVSDKPKVQLVASDMNLDVASGATAPTINQSGCTLVSGDEYIATITNDGRVQPTGYGKVTVSVSKAEDASNIYLPTTFTVTVGDSSKETSIMAFAAKASEDEANRTADDGVVWTITCSRSENEFSDVYGINYGTSNNTVTSLTLTTPANNERIIKNVVVEAMSASGTTTIGVTVGSTAFVCSKSTTMTGSVATYNFSGHATGAITITISGTASTKYGVKSIAVLYVGDEATSFASTFLGAIGCNAQGTSKPSFNIKEGQTYWTWALLAAEYNELEDSDKAKFAKNAVGVSATITECVERYDYIVGKYYVAGLDTTLISSDFMSRSPSPVGNSRIVLSSVVAKGNSTAIIIIVASAIGFAAIGGYFFLRKKER